MESRYLGFLLGLWVTRRKQFHTAKMLSRIFKFQYVLSPSQCIEAIKIYVATIASYNAMFDVAHEVLRWVHTRAVEVTYGVRMFSGRVMDQQWREGKVCLDCELGMVGVEAAHQLSRVGTVHRAKDEGVCQSLSCLRR